MLETGFIIDEHLRRIVGGGGVHLMNTSRKKGRKNERKGEIGGYKKKLNEMERKGDF